MNNLKAITDYLEAVNTDVVADQESKGIRASGQSAASKEIKAEDSKGTLNKVNFQWSIHGRKPGSFPPIEAILKWIEDKGITPEKISKRSMAFLIARKIAREGTNIAQGKTAGVSFAEITAKHLPELKKAVLKTSAINLMTKIRNTR